MMKSLYIRWDTGNMTINLDRFFPCSQRKLKKLLKVVELDTPPRSDEHITIIRGYFVEQIAAEKEYIKEHETDSKAKNRLKRWEGLLNIIQKSNLGGTPT